MMKWIERYDRAYVRVYLILHNHKIKGEEYFFLKLDPPKESHFLRMMAGTEPFSLSDFGEILTSGLGTPTAELKASMSLLYNITYNS